MSFRKEANAFFLSQIAKTWNNYLRISWFFTNFARV